MSAEALDTVPHDIARARPRAESLAHVLRSDDEALHTAQVLAERFAVDAARRDSERVLPVRELDACSKAGLWAMTVPREYGGAQVSYATVARVFAILAAADPSIAQIQQNHNSAVFWVWKTGNTQQRSFFLGEILRGARFGNANVDAGGRPASGPAMRIVPERGGFRLSGTKLYSTGMLFADYVSTIGQDEQGCRIVAVVPAGHPGMKIVDDWQSFGQKTTASGTVIFDDVWLPALNLLPIHHSYTHWPQNAVTQISHVGIDAGIARAALDATIAFIRERDAAWTSGGSSGLSSPSSPSGSPDASAQLGADPYVIHQIGELLTRLHAAEALMERAGREIDRCLADTGPDSIAAASIIVAQAKALTTEIALEASSRLFELAGTRATHLSFNLDRHWRNARVHTVHDPVRWKYAAIGNFYLNGIRPPARRDTTWNQVTLRRLFFVRFTLDLLHWRSPMPGRRHFFAAGAALAASSWIAPLGRAFAAPLDTIALGSQKTGIPLVARQLKVFEKRFEPCGIKVNWLEFPSGLVLLQALDMGRRIAFGNSGNVGCIFQQAAGET
ncbi:MAG: Acyl-CoA dehydrogenase; probable dibenzothiophene desulfurization enzyme [uncultured Paraburkholderia sp.]|nr:MAG: Acyl-CoA dehydrogenase; probable dibenzothiophene desulfurization enzyme [uncultured Paraburkholderia sp.]